MKKRIIQISLLVTVLPLMSLTVQAPDEETDGSLVVNYKGSRPVITDFIDAFLTEDAEEGSDCDNWKNEWADYRRGKPLEKRQTFTVDVRNGYVRMENKFEGGEITFHEFCFWNCSDGKHKLLVEYVGVFVGGKVVETECTGLLVYRYDNASRRLTCIGNGSDSLGLRIEANAPVSYRLPRVGKDIEVTIHSAKGPVKKILKWNGQKWH